GAFRLLRRFCFFVRLARRHDLDLDLNTGEGRTTTRHSGAEATADGTPTISQRVLHDFDEATFTLRHRLASVPVKHPRQCNVRAERKISDQKTGEPKCEVVAMLTFAETCWQFGEILLNTTVQSRGARTS